MDQLRILRVVDLKGRVPRLALADTVGRTHMAVAYSCDAMTEIGWLEDTAGGVCITARGCDVLEDLLIDERNSAEAAVVRRLFDELCVLSERSEVVFAQWRQFYYGDPHEHAAADPGCLLGGFEELHAQLIDLAERAGAAVPRLATYSDRLSIAEALLQAGDLTYIADPVLDSYYTIWLELREDLMTLAMPFPSDGADRCVYREPRSP